MIKIVKNMPAGTIGLEAVGKVTEDDYRDVLVPAVSAALERNDVRLLYILGEDFDSYSPGALWADTKLVAGHREGWKRVAIVSDAGLQQMLWNVLDNALEASRSRVSLEASTGDGQLLLRVADDGPGFAPAILERLGRPYNSSKEAPGRGLGLFLALNVARALGGTIVADNPPAGGATVAVTLPLRALSLEQDDDEH